MADDLAAQLRTSVNSFSRDFYNVVAQDNAQKSVVMSPLSAEIALALLSLGSGGDSLKELNTALYLPNQEFTKNSFKGAMETLNSLTKEGVTLSIANKLYVKDGPAYKLKEAYKADAIQVFKSDIQNLNFNENVKSAATINKWVEEKTHDKIKDLVSADSINGDTRLVLVNAIYFKGDWEKKFSPEATFKQDFFTSKTKSVQVDMMHKTAKFRYGELSDWNAKVLELPYKGGDLSMVIILPNEIEGLPDLEKKLADKNVNSVQKIESVLHEVEVEVSLPKFRIETTMDLKKYLPKMGIKSIFTGSADLSGLLENNEPLFVSEAIQKAFIEVNEEGAEAAAATVFNVLQRSGRIVRHRFKADRSFMFGILSNKQMIFAGKYVE